MRAVLIPAEGDPRAFDFDGSALPLRHLLDCRTIEALSVGRDDATAYGDEEAKLVSRTVPCACVADEANRTPGCDDCRGSGTRTVEGLPENSVATALIYGEKQTARERGDAVLDGYRRMGFEVIDATGSDPREPFIAGDVVVCGFDPQTGNHQPIPDDLAASILGDRS